MLNLNHQLFVFFIERNVYIYLYIYNMYINIYITYYIYICIYIYFYHVQFLLFPVSELFCGAVLEIFTILSVILLPISSHQLLLLIFWIAKSVLSASKEYLFSIINTFLVVFTVYIFTFNVTNIFSHICIKWPEFDKHLISRLNWIANHFPYVTL